MIFSHPLLSKLAISRHTFWHLCALTKSIQRAFAKNIYLQCSDYNIKLAEGQNLIFVKDRHMSFLFFVYFNFKFPFGFPWLESFEWFEYSVCILLDTRVWNKLKAWIDGRFPTGKSPLELSGTCLNNPSWTSAYILMDFNLVLTQLDAVSFSLNFFPFMEKNWAFLISVDSGVSGDSLFNFANIIIMDDDGLDKVNK